MVDHDNILTDGKHWLGWGITTGAVIGVFHVLGVHLHTDIIQPIALLGTIAGVDVIKHKIGLQ